MGEVASDGADEGVRGCEEEVRDTGGLNIGVTFDLAGHVALVVACYECR